MDFNHKKGGRYMERNSHYMDELKQLVLRIHTRSGRLDNNTNVKLLEVPKWECPNKEERKLLDDLIIRAKDFIDIERVIDLQKSSTCLFEKYNSYNKWFTSINNLVETVDVGLRQISFTDLSLKQSD